MMTTTQKSQEKLLPIQEFVDFGYLQEVNRQVFHLVGLELAVQDDRLVIIDKRDEPEGIFLEEIDQDAAHRVYDEFQKRAVHRKRLFEGGGPSQPMNKPMRGVDIDLYRKRNAGRKHMLNR